MNTKVSIIIPIYNAEEYLDECLSSIINQTFKDIEIICVNDGSKDNSLNIIQKYSKIDSRIRIIDKKNGGLASVRNIGVELANGEYVFFVDADDFIDNTCIEKLYTNSQQNNLDVCICDIYSYIDDNNKNMLRDLDINENFITSTEYLRKYFAGRGVPSVCNKLWRRSLYIDNDIRHPEDICFGEDGSTSPRLIYSANKIGKVKEALYFYRANPVSIMNTKDMPVYQYIKAYNTAIDYIKNKGYKDTDNQLFNYKYNYAYKRLEVVSSFDKKLKENMDYKQLYEDFIEDIKKKENNIKKPLKWDRKSTKKYLIIKAYKINTFLGGTVKTGLILINKLVKSIK